jgi:hypothetical protein
MHAGYWGPFLQQFNDTNWQGVPSDTPTGVAPDPCLAYATWTDAYKDAVLGIPLQSFDNAPGTCALNGKRANTDVLVVRRAETCVAGDPGCDPVVNGKLYFQASECGASTSGTAQAGGASTITLQNPSTAITSTKPNFYVGMTIRLTAGPGSPDTRVITSYNGATFVATVNAPWSTTPVGGTTKYTIVDRVLDTAPANFTLRQRGEDCAVAPAAGLRKFVSNIYWIRDYASTVGDGIPSLVRSSFDPGAAVSLEHQATPDVLVENVDRFAVELGFDNLVTRCGLNSAVNFNAEVAKIDPATCAVNVVNVDANTLPTNRGDGSPDTYLSCTDAAPCTADQLANVVAAKIYILARAEAATAGHTENKVYCMGSTAPDGTCPVEKRAGPFNDRIKRHLFTTTIWLPNASARRETP